jgi:prepilin-type processing-associated H-X9-DG protein
MRDCTGTEHYRLSNIKKPASKVFFLCGKYSYVGASWENDLLDMSVPPGKTAYVHNKMTNCLYFDNHVESHKYSELNWDDDFRP